MNRYWFDGEDEYYEALDLRNRMSDEEYDEEYEDEDEYGEFMKNFYGYTSHWDEPVADKETEEEKILLGFYDWRF